MKHILIYIFAFCTFGGVVSCEKQEDPDYILGPSDVPTFFFPKDTFVYDCDKHVDTISVQGKPFLVHEIYDVDHNKPKYYPYVEDSTLQFEWIKVLNTQNKLILKLDENQNENKRCMRIGLTDFFYYKNIYVIQYGIK